MTTLPPLIRGGATLTVMASALTLAGCGSENAAVRGKVVFADGKPLSSGTVVFEPADEENIFAARGPIQSDGSFRLGTKSRSDGVRPGKYRVAIETPEPERNPDNPKAPVAPRLIDRDLEKSNTSGVEFTVEPGGNDFTITVRPPPRKR